MYGKKEDFTGSIIYDEKQPSERLTSSNSAEFESVEIAKQFHIITTGIEGFSTPQNASSTNLKTPTQNIYLPCKPILYNTMKTRVISLIILLLIGICSAKTYYPLKEEWSYPIKSDAIYPLDLNRDGINELYVASYTEHMSCIYFFDYEGVKTGMYCTPGYSNAMYPHANEEITLIYVDDLNNDSILDVIAASRIIGTSVNIKKIYGIRREYEAGLDRYRYKWMWDQTPGNLIMDVDIKDVDKDGFEDIIAGSMDSNVYVFRQDGLMMFRGNLSGGIWSVAASDLDGNGHIDIVAGSLSGVSLLEATDFPQYDFRHKVISPPYRLNGIWNYSTSKRVFDVYIGDVDDDGISEILALSEDRVYLLDRNGTLIWSKSIENLVDSVIGDVDNNGTSDILLLTDEVIYSLDKRGNVRWVYDSGDTLLTVSVENDGSIFVGSENKLYRFRLDPAYFLNEEAERFYSEAYGYYLQEEYSKAIFYANKSRQLFSMVENLEGVQRCEFIFLVTQSNATKIDKRERADEYYSKAAELADLGSYEDAKDYANTALIIYWEIGDKNSVIKCDILISDIKKRMLNEKISQAVYYYRTAKEFLYNNTFVNASIYALEALKAYQELNDTEGVSNSESLIQEIRLREKIYFADYLYSLSIQSSDLGDYENATMYIEKAKKIYIELNNSDKIRECDSLLDIYGRYIEAGSYLDLAQKYYRNAYLGDATMYIEKAKKIYIELNNSKEIGRCDFLLSEIEKMRRESLLNYVILAAPVLVVITLIIFLHLRKQRRET